jgi:hypothetical protein
MSTRRTEVFENIKTQGFIFTTPSNSTDTTTAGIYPNRNSTFQIVDSQGTAEFRPDINCQSATVNSLITASATVTNITAASGTFTRLVTTGAPITTTANLVAAGDGNTSGSVRAKRIQLRDQVTGATGTLDTSSNSVYWTDASGSRTDLLGWNTAFNTKTNINLLDWTGADVTTTNIISTLNQLLMALEDAGAFVMCPNRNVDPPNGLSLSNFTMNSITLTWNIVTTGLSRSIVEYTPSSSYPGTWTQITGVTGSTLTITGLSSSTLYYFRVSSFLNSESVSSPSSVISGSTIQ